MHFISNLQAL